MEASRAVKYANVNKHKPRYYWNYQRYDIEWKDTEGYELVRKLGRGKYSVVFEAIDVENDKQCAVKVLKPCHELKIKREIKILRSLRGGTNIIILEATVMDVISKTPSLIFEYAENTYYKVLYPKFSDFDVRYFMYELLKALDYCHSMGIMHRDLKPENVMIDYKNRKLRLIDFGGSEFYHPDMAYPTAIGTLHFKAPELLVEYPMYNYTVDMWAFGCIFSSIIFKMTPFFQGLGSLHQLICITEVLGTEDFDAFLNKYHILISGYYKDFIRSHPRKAWTSFANDSNRHLLSTNAFDLLDMLLCYDHIKRISASEAMAHKYFRSVRYENCRRLVNEKLLTSSTEIKSASYKPLAYNTKKKSCTNTSLVLNASAIPSNSENFTSGTKGELASSNNSKFSTLATPLKVGNYRHLALSTKAESANNQPLGSCTFAIPDYGKASTSVCKAGLENYSLLAMGMKQASGNNKPVELDTFANPCNFKPCTSGIKVTHGDYAPLAFNTKRLSGNDVSDVSAVLGALTIANNNELSTLGNNRLLPLNTIKALGYDQPLTCDTSAMPDNSIPSTSGTKVDYRNDGLLALCTKKISGNWVPIISDMSAMSGKYKLSMPNKKK